MTILEMLHEIEQRKTIYNIHYCQAGVGIQFFYQKKLLQSSLSSPVLAKWIDGLNIDRYYPTFEEAVEAEYNKLEDLT